MTEKEQLFYSFVAAALSGLISYSGDGNEGAAVMRAKTRQAVAFAHEQMAAIDERPFVTAEAAPRPHAAQNPTARSFAAK